MMYFIILYLVLTGTRTQDSNFAIYLFSGVIFFHVFVRGTMGGLTSIVNGSGIINSIKIEKEFFPVVSTLAIAILSLVDIAVFFALMPVFGFTPTWTLILFPIPWILLIVLILGLSYLLSVINAFSRDIHHFWIAFSTAFLFISPIFWKIENASGIILTIHKINPLGQIIELSHSLVVYGKVPPIETWAYVTIFVVAIFFIGYYTFNKLQPKIAEVL